MQLVDLKVVDEPGVILSVRFVGNHVGASACKEERQQALEGAYIVHDEASKIEASPECVFLCLVMRGKKMRRPSQPALASHASNQTVPDGIREAVEEIFAYPGNRPMLSRIVAKCKVAFGDARFQSRFN